MIRILHHHLRRGGVTRVMEGAARILRDAGEPVTVYSGEAPPGTFPAEVDLRVWPELGYRNDFDPADADALAERMRNETRDGDLWHVHNHSLGKSPVVTAAVLSLAETGVPLVLQPHDFAEDGRPANRVRLREGLPDGLRRLYPVAAHIRYAVLQDRDRRILISAGVPSEHIRVLPNPVGEEGRFAPPRHPPERVLYLTRGIRRKNMGEFLYWAWRCRDSAVFATSLTPENPAEIATFTPWVGLAETMGLKIRWGIGMDGRSFRNVVEEGDVCITTSVAEGFGMSFLEPFAMGRAVVGRDLPGITDGFRQDGMDLSALYTALPVPVDALDPEFWPRAEKAVAGWRRAMGLAGETGGETLRAAWMENGHIDFGKLDEPAQRHVLRTRASDLPGEDWLSLAGDHPVDANRETIGRAYGPEGYRDRLCSLYADIREAGPVGYADADAVRDAFSDPAGLTLLRV